MGLEFIGAMAIMVCGALLAVLVQHCVSDPAFPQYLAAFSPWLSSHAGAVSWTALGLVVVITLAVPPVLMFSRGPDGASRMEGLGRGISMAVQAVAAVLWIPSIAYLAGLAWYAARHVISN